MYAVARRKREGEKVIWGRDRPRDNEVASRASRVRWSMIASGAGATQA